MKSAFVSRLIAGAALLGLSSCVYAPLRPQTYAPPRPQTYGPLPMSRSHVVYHPCGPASHWVRGHHGPAGDWIAGYCIPDRLY